MSSHQPHLSWVNGYSARRQGIYPDIWTTEYRLTDLMKQGYIDPGEGYDLLYDSGLDDFFWQITWSGDDQMPDEDLADRIADMQGYVVFVHGWTGNHRIWEELPAMLVSSNRRLAAISIDHNGFGFSRFTDITPALQTCNPPAAMRVIQRWVDLLKIRRQPGITGNKVVNFVGHSMGGATLFYLDPMRWYYGEVTRYALAPALLLEDELRQIFYTTLGIGIGILHHVPALNIVERFVKPGMVRTLAAGASNFVKHEHSRQYEMTPRGITGATFMAMGLLRDHEIPRDWTLMRVMLGHRDRLVGLVDMMDLLCALEFPAGNIRVVPGTHYMFSVGSENPANAFQHAQNRELVLQDILQLHDRAYAMQRQGHLIG